MIDWIAARERLVPIVRPATFPTSALRAAATDPARALVRQRLVPFLHVLLGIDLGDRLRYASRGDLDAWRVDGDHAFALARDSLDPRVELERRPDGAARVRRDDGYEASMLALRGWLSRLAPAVGGPPLLIAPHAGYVVVGHEKHLPDLVLEAETGWRHGATPLAPLVFREGPDGALLPFLPPPGHPQRARLVNLTRRLAEQAYRDQAWILEDLVEGVVARLGLIEDGATGALVSVTAWTEGTRPLLPHADLVVLHPDRGPERWVPFAALAAVGALVPHEELDPPRFVGATWPTGDAWARVEAASVPGLAR